MIDEFPGIREITVRRPRQSLSRFLLEWFIGGFLGLILGGLILHFYFKIPITNILPVVIWPLKYKF